MAQELVRVPPLEPKRCLERRNSEVLSGLACWGPVTERLQECAVK
jgi:hypothetical protein